MKKNIDTSFRSFLKHKLNEAKKTLNNDELILEPVEGENKDNEFPNKETEIMDRRNYIKGRKPFDQEYMSELIREYNKIMEEYDSLYKHR